MSYCSNVHCSRDPCIKHDPQAPVQTDGPPSVPVLLAVDGSSFSMYAIRWALHMFDSNFMIVHAYDYVPSGLDALGTSLTLGGEKASEYMDALRVQAELKAYSVLEAAENLFDELGASTRLVKSLVVRGEARAVVTSCVKDYGVEVLAMGSRGVTGVSRVLGSVSDYLLHNATCHVCIVHSPLQPSAAAEQSLLETVVDLGADDSAETKMAEIASMELPNVARTIYIALDGSEQAQKGYEWARDHFLKKNDQVVLVMAYTPTRERRNSLLGLASLFGPPTYSFGQEEEKDKVDAMYTRLKDYAVRLAPEIKKMTGNNCRMCLQSGDPRDVICNVTEHTAQVDVLVMGSRGRGMVKRAVLGSVVDYVATHAKVSIMVVK